MAWIKMRTDLRDDPDVIAIADALDLSGDLTVAKLHTIWSWADAQTTDGTVPRVKPAWLDEHVGIPGFSEAMQSVGWLEIDDDGLTFPNFDVHMSEGAKKRAVDAKAASARRKKGKKNPTPARRVAETATNVAKSATKLRPREEKRREEKSKETPSESLSTGVDDDKSGGKPNSPQEFFDRWNTFAESRELVAVAEALTDERRKKIKTRLNSKVWYPLFRRALAKLPIPNDEKFTWQPDFDWLIANDTNVAKVVEGRYDRRGGQQTTDGPAEATGDYAS